MLFTTVTYNSLYVQGGPEKPHSFAYDNFLTICRRIAPFAPKCLDEISYC